MGIATSDRTLFTQKRSGRECAGLVSSCADPDMKYMQLSGHGPAFHDPGSRDGGASASGKTADKIVRMTTERIRKGQPARAASAGSIRTGAFFVSGGGASAPLRQAKRPQDITK